MSLVKKLTKIDSRAIKLRRIIIVILILSTSVAIYYLYTQYMQGKIQLVLSSLGQIDPTYLSITLLTIGTIIPSVLGIYLVIYYLSRVMEILSERLVDVREIDEKLMSIINKIEGLYELGIKIDKLGEYINNLGVAHEDSNEEKRIETKEESNESYIEIIEADKDKQGFNKSERELSIFKQIQEIRSLVEEMGKLEDKLKRLKETL